MKIKINHRLYILYFKRIINGIQLKGYLIIVVV